MTNFSFPAPPAYRAPGGVATDISGGLASFAKSLQDRRDQAALEAFHNAQLKLESDKLAQDTSQAELDRQLKKYIADQQAAVEHERNRRIRDEQERDRAAAIETTTRDLRGEFQRQLGERGKQHVADAYRRILQLNAKGEANLTPAERDEVKQLGTVVGLGQMGVSPELSHADSVSALDAATAAATGPLSSVAADRLRRSLGLDRSPSPTPAPTHRPLSLSPLERRKDGESADDWARRLLQFHPKERVQQILEEAGIQVRSSAGR